MLLANSAAMSQLFAAASGSESTLAQIIAASISAQMQNKTQSSSGKGSNKNGSCNLICSICGQMSRDSTDYEQHLMSHLTMLDAANQKAYQYGIQFLRMQNMLHENDSSGANGVNKSKTAAASSSASFSPQSSSSTAIVMNKKRKLLLGQNRSDDSSNKATPNKNSALSKTCNSDYCDSDQKRSRTEASNQLVDINSEQSTQNLLHQLSAAAAVAAAAAASNSNQQNGKNFASNPPIASASTPSSNSSSDPTTNTNHNSAMATAYPCTSCHKTFATEVDLKAHLIRHLTQHPFVCVSCGKGFKYEHSLNFHIKSYHSGNSKSNASERNSFTTAKSGKSQSSVKVDTNDCPSSNGASNKKRNNFNIVSDTNETEERKIAGKSMYANGSSVYENENTPKAFSFGLNVKSQQSAASHVDENHNHTINKASSCNSSVPPDMSYFFGKPPTNFPTDSSIQIRSEKLLISIFDAVDLSTDQSFVFYKCCLCCVAFASLDQMNVHIQNVHIMNGNNDGTSSDSSNLPTNMLSALSFSPKISIDADTKDKSYQCDKCTAKFNQPMEYEIHSQLHRTLEASHNSSSLNGNGLYQLGLLNLNQYGSSGNVNSNAISSTTSLSNSKSGSLVDFRQILANASKDTDFGRKFAAQLLEGSSNGKSIDEYDAGDSNKILAGNEGNFSLPSHTFGRNSPQTNGKLNDNNNNSLLYMSLLPEHGSSVPTNVGKNKNNYHHKSNSSSSSSIKSSPSNNLISNSPNNKPSKSFSLIGKSGPSSRHIKEPVDIFEGAGQSLPIQKFPIGDIEETAPGQFKCRFCEKTFDRVFSVHRHERVHTGFKPCVCKTCGRGFSEKRNLRHHIIRFHSDGSGRELLKRKRKPKPNGGFVSPMNSSQVGDSHSESSALLLQQFETGAKPTSDNSLMMSNDKVSSSFMSSLLSAGSILNAAFRLPNKQSRSSPVDNSEVGSLSNLKISLAEMDRMKQSEDNNFDDECDGDEDDENNEEYDFDQENGEKSSATSSSDVQKSCTGKESYTNNGSRRRKSKPSKKIFNPNEDDDDDENSTDDKISDHQKEMMVVNVDLPVMEDETTDGPSFEDIKSSGNTSITKASTSENDGDETEEESTSQQLSDNKSRSPPFGDDSECTDTEQEATGTHLNAGSNLASKEANHSKRLQSNEQTSDGSTKLKPTGKERNSSTSTSSSNRRCGGGSVNTGRKRKRSR